MPPQERRLELSLPFPPAFEKLVAEFIRVCGLNLPEETQASLEEALRETVYQMGPENGEGRCWLAVHSLADTLVFRVRDQRTEAALGQPDGGWNSPWRKLFSRVEYLSKPEGSELRLAFSLAPDKPADFSSPLPLPEHKVIAGATLAG